MAGRWVLAAVVAVSLACGGRGAAARDAACERACTEAEQKCQKECPDRADRACDAACGKLESACVKKCEAQVRLRPQN